MGKRASGSAGGTEQERAARARELRERIKLSISGKRPPASPREATDEAAMEEYARARKKKEGGDESGEP